MTLANEATTLFTELDQLNVRKREIENRLRTLRTAYMVEARLWGISDERFRQEIKAAI
jgi:hypothetical protein